MSTTFPNSTQTFKKWENLSQSQLSAYLQYISNLNAGNWSAARQAFVDGGLSETMLPTANDFNAMCDTILECRTLYEAEDTSAKGIQTFMGQFTYKGRWQSATASIGEYKKFNIVRYSNAENGGSYLFIANQDITATVNPYTNSLSSSPQWLRLAPISITNTDSVYRGNYISSANYFIGDVVTYNNSFWIALSDNSDEPTSTSSDWQQLLNLNLYMAQYSSSEPENLPVNGIWFKEVN